MQTRQQAMQTQQQAMQTQLSLQLTLTFLLTVGVGFVYLRGRR